jgi:hypothetical protein
MVHDPSRVAALLAVSLMVLGCIDAQPGNQAGAQLTSSSCPQQTMSMPLLASVPMPETPLVLGASTVTLPLLAPDDRSTAQRLASAAQSEAESVVLQIRCVEADRQPGAIWEVYVGLPPQAEANAESPHFVGTVALLSDGIRSEQGHEPFAEFVFVLDRAIVASNASQLSVAFVPASGIVADGRPTPAEVSAPVRIGEVNLLLGEPGR